MGNHRLPARSTVASLQHLMSAGSDAATADLTLPAGARDHASGGGGDAPLTLVEYGDFECPQCAQAFGVIKELQAAFGARLRFVFRHFPLTNVHPHAQRAAETAEWAAASGKFWEMHDALFADRAHLADRDLLARARALGLDAADLERAWATHRYVPRVKEDFLSGLRSGAAGTPTFFINGARHEGAWDAVALTRALEKAAAGAPRPSP